MDKNLHDKESVEQFIRTVTDNRRKAMEFIAGMEYRPVLADYREVSVNQWQITKPEGIGIAKDYVGKAAKFDNIILTNTSDSHADSGIWMSLSSMELQSHIIHINSLISAAKADSEAGKVPHFVIGGLGLGMFTLSAIYHLNELGIESRITVVELDPSMPELLQKSLTGYSNHKFEMALAGFDRVELEIVIGDITEIEPFDDVSYMYVDIWKGLATCEAPIMSKALVERWKPNAYGYWGEEIDIAAYGTPLVDYLNLAFKYDTPEAIQFCETVYYSQTEFICPEVKRPLSALIKPESK